MRGSSSTSVRTRRRRIRLGVPFTAAFCFIGAVDAQEPPSVAQAEADYNAATRAYEAAILAHEAVYLEFDVALSRVAEARSGDDEAYGVAQNRVRGISRELYRLERRVSETLQEREVQREDLLAAIYREMDQLDLQFAAETSILRRNGLQARLADLDFESLSLEDERINDRPSPLTFMPHISLDPRDGPLEISGKTQILEARLIEMQELVSEMELEIERLEERRRRQQSRRNFSSSLNRFDDSRPPGVTTTIRDPLEEGLPADSTSAAQSEPLDVRIQSIRDLQDQLRVFIDQLQEQVSEARRRLELIGW